MVKIVQDLSRDELNELKSNFFYQDETQDINEGTFSPPPKIFLMKSSLNTTMVCVS